MQKSKEEMAKEYAKSVNRPGGAVFKTSAQKAEQHYLAGYSAAQDEPIDIAALASLRAENWTLKDHNEVHVKTIFDQQKRITELTSALRAAKALLFSNRVTSTPALIQLESKIDQVLKERP